jgi:hypothetical protein
MQRSDSGATPEARPPRPPKRRRIEILVVVVLLVAAGVVVKVVLEPGPKPPEIITPGSTIAPPRPVPDEQAMNTRASACLSTTRRTAGRITKPTGALRTYRYHTVPDSRTYDLRSASIVGYPSASLYPFALGKYDPGKGTCVIGGSVVGTQSRALTWQGMKAGVDGDGFYFKSHGGVIDGLRIANVEDGIGTVGGDPEGILIRNVHMSYIRDDCIENDYVVGLIVKDSLLDGCFFGLSQRPVVGAHPPVPPAGERTLLDGVLLRLAPMPYERSQARCAADGLGTGGFFKWSPYANKLVIRNSILMAERLAANCAGAMHIPIDGTYQNVKLVWLGPGAYPGSLPASGVTVTRDRRVWDNAKAAWLTRHPRR